MSGQAHRSTSRFAINSQQLCVLWAVISALFLSSFSCWKHLDQFEMKMINIVQRKQLNHTMQTPASTSLGDPRQANNNVSMKLNFLCSRVMLWSPLWINIDWLICIMYLKWISIEFKATKLYSVKKNYFSFKRRSRTTNKTTTWNGQIWALTSAPLITFSFLRDCHTFLTLE